MAKHILWRGLLAGLLAAIPAFLIAKLLADATRDVAIYTRDLDPPLLDVAPVLDALRRIALSGRGARIRVIVHEPRKALADGHRLIALAQRLPSVVEFRAQFFW